MARVAVTTQTATEYVTAPSLTAANVDGDAIDAGNVRLVVTNGSASPVDVTVTTTAEVAGLAAEDLVVEVPASGTRWIGPFPKGVFGQPVGQPFAGQVHVDYESVTSVTRAVVAV